MRDHVSTTYTRGLVYPYERSEKRTGAVKLAKSPLNDAMDCVVAISSALLSQIKEGD